MPVFVSTRDIQQSKSIALVRSCVLGTVQATNSGAHPLCWTGGIKCSSYMCHLIEGRRQAQVELLLLWVTVDNSSGSGWWATRNVGNDFCFV